MASVFRRPVNKVFPFVFRALIGVFGIFTLGFLVLHSLRLAEAEHFASSYTVEGMKRAAELVPNNADYLALLSDREADAGMEPSRSMRTLETALALNPRDTAAWIDLGVRAELSGDLGKAERSYLAAANADRQFWPRWNLAQFYSRIHDRSKFAYWARATAEMARNEQDLYPLFALCWNMSDDAETVFRRFLPDKPSVYRIYLAFLLDHGRLDVSEPVADRILGFGDKQDVNLLLTLCDRLLAGAGDRGPNSKTALEIWNSLVDRGLLPYQEIRPEREPSIVNGDFHLQPVSLGFDWKLANPPGVSTLVDHSLIATFSGRQSEKCELASQFVALAPSAHYSIAFEYRTVYAMDTTGLVCRIFEVPSGKLLSSDFPWNASPEWKAGSVRFSSSPDADLVRLMFGYERPFGMMRLEGTICLRNVRISRAT